MSLFVSCGEPSGDRYLAQIVHALRRAAYEGDIWGMAGDGGSSAGVEAIWNISELQIMGISEALLALPRLMKLKGQIVREVLDRHPEAVILVDCPDFHLSLLRSLRRGGYWGRVIYVVPPTVWAWRSRRTALLRRYCDLCLPLFQFEHNYLRKAGVRSRWIGHPLLDDPGTFNPAEMPAVDAGGRHVAMLPGSRPGEVRRLLPVLIGVARRLPAMSLEPVFSIAPGLPPEKRRLLLKELSEFKCYEGDARSLVARSVAAVGASGTMTVEAMMLDRFMVVIYRVSLLSELVFRLLVRTPWISLPNLLAGETIYPELLQRDATETNIVKELAAYVDSKSIRRRVHAGLARSRKSMGRGGATSYWAQAILEELL